VLKTLCPVTPAVSAVFFETNFVAYDLSTNALITGYFEPEFEGSKNYTPAFTVPVYAKPADPVLASLPRAAIDNNALYRKAPVTAYLSNAADAFMLEIFGAGRVLLPDGNILRVDFDGQNGQPYTPIGRILVTAGDLAPDDVNFQSISAWLRTHPHQAQGVMEQNANYVYLKPLGPLPDDEGAPGSLGVPKTAGCTLAVDSSVIPLGIPVFMTMTDPITGSSLVRLAVAQDTDAACMVPPRSNCS